MGVRHHDHDGVRGEARGGSGHTPDDLAVRREEVVAAHARLARQTGSYYYYIRTGSIFIAVRAGNIRIITRDRSCFEQIKGLALRDPLGHIHQHHISQLRLNNPLRQRCTNMACTYYRYFPTQSSTSSCSYSCMSAFI